MVFTQSTLWCKIRAQKLVPTSFWEYNTIYIFFRIFRSLKKCFVLTIFSRHYFPLFKISHMWLFEVDNCIKFICSFLFMENLKFDKNLVLRFVKKLMLNIFPQKLVKRMLGSLLAFNLRQPSNACRYTAVNAILLRWILVSNGSIIFLFGGFWHKVCLLFYVLRHLKKRFMGLQIYPLSSALNVALRSL